MKETLRTFILYIEDDLIQIEAIVNKYIPDPADVYFIPEKRFPLENNGLISKYQNTGLLSQRPYLPYKSVPIVIETIKYLLANDSGYVDMFVKNPLCEAPSYIDPVFYGFLDIEEILSQTLNMPYNDDLQTVYNYIINIFQKVYKIVSGETARVYSFNYEETNIIMEQHEEIGTIRFKEFMEHKKLLEEIEIQEKLEKGLYNGGDIGSQLPVGEILGRENKLYKKGGSFSSRFKRY